MDTCHVVSRSPANASAATVVTLIRNIEQLKNKDKLISQLERDLGHRWAAAQFATLERTQGEGAESAPSHPPGVLPEGRQDPDSFSWTPTSTPTPGDVEDERSAGDEGFVTGKNDLPKKLKERNKELVERCRGYLQRAKELTVHNRELKDSQDRAMLDNNKLQELLEHSKLRLLQVTRQVTELKAERRDVTGQAERLADMRGEIEEGKKKIAALQQACDEKDRRIELIQHRKKRRRVMGSAERTMGVRETFYGYDVIDEDSNSDTSSMTHSGHSTLSDDDIWGVLSREETERNYHRLALEQLQLQRSHAQLQSEIGGLQDPQREALTRSQTQQDLFEAHCRIEQLEKIIDEIGEDDVISMLKEREEILFQNKTLYEKLTSMTDANKSLVKELAAADDKIEELEFRLIEWEEMEDFAANPACTASEQSAAPGEADPGTEGHQEVEEVVEDGSSEVVSVVSSPTSRDCQACHTADCQCCHTADCDMDQLRKELAVLLKGKGKEADAVLRKLDRLKNIEENAASMEEVAHELQKRIVAMQNDYDNLQSELKSKGSKSKERQENLELKVEVTRLRTTETELADEKDALLEQVSDLKTQNVHLKRQLDIVTSTPVKVTEINSSDSESPNQSPRRRKSKSRGEDDSTPETKRRKNSDSGGLKSVRSFADVRSSGEESESAEKERMLRQLRKLETELRGSKDENIVLMSRLKQSVMEKSSAAEADQGLVERLHELENELDLLRQENETLAQRQQRREEELDSGEVSPRTAELEEFCEDLQERLHSAESSERHLREKLKMVEGIIQDYESSETTMREEIDRLMVWEVEAKSQLAELQKMVVELKDLLQDKDIHEQGLRIKVDFLQKAEAASVQRIAELEAVLGDLREQLELAGSGDEAARLQELRKQMSYLETDNAALSSRVAELEENEETLRENWRRVAEDDHNRTQCLEEKLKMLQNLNEDLKSKLSDAQEYFVINTVPQNSLASELAQSQTSLRSAAPYSGSDDSETEEDAEARQLREKLRKLERKLTEVTDHKDGKIETLQGEIVGYKETEIKLSETISEMEMTEREIRAKLALYESSEVTVEKMLKYQSKIQELRTSQESLLDQLDQMESEEMTKQEQMQEMERTLRGSIVTLEVEMKSYKQKELKTAARTRELEKVEKELSEKVTVQADKENGLYVRISALMDELKELKEEGTRLKAELAEKDEKVRSAKLLEVKLLEIEMEFGKKSSALSSQLRRREEDLRQKDVALGEVTCEREEARSRVDELTEEIDVLRKSKDGFEARIEDLTQEVSFMKSVGMESEEKLSETTEELMREKKRSGDLEKKARLMEEELNKERKTVSELENQISTLRDDISQKVQKSESVVFEKEQEYEKERDTLASELELKINRVNELEKEVNDLNEHILVIETECKKVKSEAMTAESKLSERLELLEKSMGDKEAAVSELKVAHNEAIDRMEAELKSAQAISEEKDDEINELMKDRNMTVGQKEEEVSRLESEVAEIKQLLDDKSLELEIAQEELMRSAREHEQEVGVMKGERELLEKELRNKVMFLNSQLTKETEARELQQSSLEEQGGQTEVLTQEIDQYKRELMEKISELESKNKDNCQLSLELSQVNHSLKTMQLEFDAARQNWSKSETELQNQLTDIQNQLCKKEQTVNKYENDLKNLHVQFSELESNLCEKEISMEEMRSNYAIVEQKLTEKERLVEEKSQKEVVAQEHMQKTAHLLQESGREKQNHETQLAEMKRELEEKTSLLVTTQSQLDDQKSKCEGLQAELSEIKEKLMYQTEELQEKSGLQKLNDKEIEVLKKRLQETERSLSEKESEDFENSTQMASIVSNQQQDLAHAHEELKKCLQDIQQAKDECFIKEQQIKEKDQTYNELLVEQQELKLQLDEHKQELVEQKEETETVEGKMAAVQQDLREAENRYRELEAKVASLEMQLEERFASAQSAEKVLFSKDTDMQEMHTKLVLAEKQYAEACSDLSKLKDDFKDLECKQDMVEKQHAESQAALQEKEELCEKLEADLEMVSSECEILKAESSDRQLKLAEYEKNLDHAQQKESEVQNSLHDAQIKCEDSIKQVLDLQKGLENTDLQLKEKCAENKDLIKNLAEAEEKLKDVENIEKLKTEQSADQISQSNVSLKEETDNLKSQLESLTCKNDEMTALMSANDREFKDAKQELENVNEHLEDVSHKLEDATIRLVAMTEQHYSQQGELLAQTAQIEGLELGVREKGHRCEFLEANLEDICLEKDAALSEVKHLESVVEKLETENLGLHEELDDASKEFENLRRGFEESKTSIEGRLMEMARGKEELEEKLKALETSSNKKSDDAFDNTEASRLLEEVLVGSQSLVPNVEEIDSLKLRINELETQLSESEKDGFGNKYAELKEAYEVGQKDLTQERAKSKMLIDRMNCLLGDNESLTEECINLNHTIEELRLKLNKTNVADESQINVSLVSNLSSAPNELELNHNETVSKNVVEQNIKIKNLLDEIKVFKEKDTESQQKLQKLESCLNELKETESKLAIRVEQLEVKEKDLLEHIADIEKTVIVPLESENDELKQELSDMRDEVTVVKEERDEAIAMLDTEEDSARDLQACRRDLQDSLTEREELEKTVQDSVVVREELEKHNVELSERVAHLDEEKQELCKKISELEDAKAELECEKVDVEEKMTQLEGLQRQKSVVEEDRLMDRVLDLEEKEQHLVADNEQLRKDQSILKSNEAALQDKLKYLQEKNEVLQDAEEKYMDKIMELEEIKHRYQSQLALIEATPTHEPIMAKSEPIEPIVVSESLSQVHVSRVDVESLQPSKTNISVDTSDLATSSEDVSIDLSETPQPQHAVHILESENERLKNDVDNKKSEIDSLQKKYELLQDSEARLMEKLEEVQEKAEAVTSKSDVSEQEKKIDALLEENEFLAENIENYKRFFKEEKQKVNDLNDRLLEESSQVQELQAMVGEIQSEYEDQLQQEQTKHAEEQAKLVEETAARVDGLLREKEELQQERDDLLKKVSNLEIEVRSVVSWKKVKESEEKDESRVSELQEKITEIAELKEKLAEIEEQREKNNESEDLKNKLAEVDNLREKASEVEELREKISEMGELQRKLSELSSQNDKLLATLQMEEDVRAQENLRRQELQGKVDALSQRKEELRTQHKEREQRLQGEIDAASQREVAAVKALEALEVELSDMRQAVVRQDRRGVSVEEEHQSDSGLSVDADRGRYDSLESKASLQETSGSPITFSSIATLTLTRPQSASPVNHDGRGPPPVAPPRANRKSKSRGSSFDSASDRDLADDQREAALLARIQELESKTSDERSDDLSQRVAELETKNENLETKNESLRRRVKLAERESEARRDRDAHLAGLGEITWGVREEEEREVRDEESSHLNTSFSSNSSSMLERPEDVLHQRVKELERLDQHNKDQMSELERDREVLHEIARKDKNSIHDLHVKVRELQLSERSLKEQVNSLEVSETSLYSRCSEMEAHRSRLEDRVHELEIHERRLRELVRRLKLDEEHWLSKSGGMENAVAELSANEQQLKRMLQNVELERGGMAERTEYMEARVQELEAVEVSLLQRIKNYENNEVTLQNRLVHLENSTQAAQSKASELDVINMDVSQRLQRAVEENSVMSQHNTQLHGQVQDLDRRLMTSRDAELAYKQHVEALQKNESSLQKKVREYELREIDSQGRIRELEQTMEITQDKLATLQRSENKLKYRVQELEGIGGQIPGELTPGQRQKVPQKLEDCQKRVMVLQAQVESLQVQLRQALNMAHSDTKSQNEDNTKLSVSKDDYNRLQTRVLLLDETTSQLEEVEKLNEGLNSTILELRQGKGASGHEVEIEVLKRRLNSYKTLMTRLKSSLSTGQATSLLEPDSDSGPEGTSLPDPSLPGMAAERVLQSVRGDGKAEPLGTHTLGGAPRPGLAHSDGSPVHRAVVNQTPPVGDRDNELQQPSQPSNREESHWRAIEARRPPGGEGPRGGTPTAPGVTVTKSQSHGARRDSLEEEEVTLGLHLPSESESRLTYNDTDSSVSAPVPPPRRGRAPRAAVNYSSASESNDGRVQPTSELSRTAASANKKHFAPKEKSLPSPAGHAALGGDQSQWALKKHNASLMSFGEDSFYLPSSVPEVGDSRSESDEAPPLPHSRPPGVDSRPPGVVTSSPRGSSDDLSEGMTSDLQGKHASLDDSDTSGMSIRDRIAMIERQLTDTGGRSDDDEVWNWKKKSSEATRQAETLEKENKHLKEDINKLEKELEEKRRYINLLELWLSSAETTFKNEDKQTDRVILEQVQMDLSQLRKQLSQVGYRSEDAVLDPAALKTELERREREVMTKKSEVEVLSLELRRTRSECECIEGMRRTALDSLRGLERELVGLEDAEGRSKQLEEKLKLLQGQYDEMESYKTQAVNMIQPLQVQVDRLTRKCKEKDALLRRLGAELRRVCHRPSSVLDDLTRLENLMTKEENKKSSTSPRNVTRSNSMDELDLGYPLSDTDSVGGESSLGRRPRPAPYVNNRPRSAESQHAQRGAHAHSRWGHRANQPMVAGVTRGQFVAVADYDPAMFSQSGRPEMELALREGDHVVITGSLDPSGYYEAVVSGRSGLVPASYLQPLNGHHMTHEASHVDHSPEETVDLYQRLNQAQKPTGQPVRQPRTASMEKMPEPPRQLQVEAVVNEKSILLSWLPPPLDERGCSNGYKVLGYMVYLDGAEFEQVSGCGQCQVVLDGLTDRPHRLGVQCLCGGGFASPRAELVFEGLVKLDKSIPDLDTDLSSVLNSVHYKRGHKRMVMALYDYSPAHQSPHDYTALELGFAAGDVIHVYGDPRQDGFFHGEIEGKRGLVPACFVQDVTPEKLKSSHKRSS